MMRGEALEKSMFFMSNPDWYYYLDEDDDEQFPLLTDKAPPEAVESYNYAKKTSLDKGTQRKTTENELPSLTQCTA